MNFLEAKKFILKKLKGELSENLYYHEIIHTIDVCKASNQIALMEKIQKNDLLLLKTASLFHDTGFLIQYDNNEAYGASIAQHILPKFDYKDNEINIIKELILATQIPHKPKNKLEKIICDADMDYLGRDDFFARALLLHREWNEHGYKTSLREWYIQQFDFIKQHIFFTDSSIRLRQEKKLFHLNQIKELLMII